MGGRYVHRDALQYDPLARTWLVVFLLWVGVFSLWVAGDSLGLFGVGSALPETLGAYLGTAFVVLVVLLAVVVLVPPTTRQSDLLAKIDQEREDVDQYLNTLTDGSSTSGKPIAVSDGPAPSPEIGGEATVDPERPGETDDGTERSTSAIDAQTTLSRDELIHRFETAQQALEKARTQVYRRDYTTALRLYYQASRQELLLYDTSARSGDEATDGESDGEDDQTGTDTAFRSARTANLRTRLLSFARASMSGHQKRLVETYLSKPPGELSPLDMYYAVEVMHQWNVEENRKARQTRQYLQLGIGVLLSLLVVIVWSSTVTFQSLLSLDSAIGGPTFDALVVLMGASGAVFSILLKSAEQLQSRGTDPTVPSPAYLHETVVLRVLIGAASAPIVLALIHSDVGSAVLNSDLQESTTIVLLVAFVAGFSERLVKRSLNDLTGSLLDENEETPDTPSTEEEASGQ